MPMHVLGLQRHKVQGAVQLAVSLTQLIYNFHQNMINATSW